MKVAVRYCSQFGRTRTIAEEMADELGVDAVSVTDEPTLAERVDVLFLGGAPYLSIMDPALEEYASRLTPDMVGRVVLFTTSNWSHRTAIGLRAKLKEHGVAVAPGHFFAHMSMIEQSKPAARAFAREEANKTAELESSDNEAQSEKMGHVKELATEAASVLAVAAAVVAVVAVTRRVIGWRRALAR